MAAISSMVVAVFEDYASAEKAVRELEQSGISCDRIHIESNARTATAGGSGYAAHEGGISGFFQRLFDSDEEVARHSTQYESAVAGGRSIVTVGGFDDSDDVVALLNQYGALDVDSGKRSVQQGGVRVYSKAELNEWDQNALAYGSAMANDTRYTGHAWRDVEADLRLGYERDYPASDWNRVRASVRAGWDKVSAR